MLNTLVQLMGLVIFASILQRNYKIPSPITLMTSVLGLKLFGISIFNLNAQQFDTLVLITLPLLIATDALKMKWEDLKTHGFSLFWVAVISVVATVLAGALIKDYMLVEYAIPVAGIVMLFCMVAATDPITVAAIFANFKVPHKLKVLTEGESLFNDATALIVFSIAIVSLQNPEQVTVAFIAQKSFMVIFGAIGVGVALGYITTVILKLSEDAFVEAAILLLAAYSSYIIAEHFHCSGILAVIFTMIIANRVIQKMIKVDDQNIEHADKSKNIGLLQYAVTTKDNHETVVKSLDFVSMFASAILFISIAAVANFDKLLEHSNEILVVFVASTVIRGLMMLKFALVSNNTKHMLSIQKHWWAVLTFAGSKGAISILMVHLIPASFTHKELFEHIIVGNILLSTFVYALILAVLFMKNRIKFEAECKEEEHH